MAQRVKCLPALREIWVQSLSWEDPLEKEMATHSSTLAWKIPWTEEPGRLQYMGLAKSILYSVLYVKFERSFKNSYSKFYVSIPMLLRQLHNIFL